MKTEVILKSLPEVIVASMHTRVPDCDSYFDVVPEMGEYKESDIDVEICEAVISPCEDSEILIPVQKKGA